MTSPVADIPTSEMCEREICSGTSKPNLSLYAIGARVPDEACRPFTRPGGFSGTDINAMWRIKALTEMVGPCGIGWYTETVKRWTEHYEETGEAKVYCDINLYIRNPATGEWSKPITGTGGNSVILSRNKKDSLGNIIGTVEYANDEMYKMAETDAFGSACKKLGIGASVYWSSDKSKYTISEDGDVVEYIPTQEEIRAENRARKAAQAGSFMQSPKVGSPSFDRDLAQIRKSLVVMRTDETTSPVVAQIYAAYTERLGDLMSKWPEDAQRECYDQCVKAVREAQKEGSA